MQNLERPMETGRSSSEYPPAMPDFVPVIRQSRPPLSARLSKPQPKANECGDAADHAYGVAAVRIMGHEQADYAANDRRGKQAGQPDRYRSREVHPACNVTALDASQQISK
jgi:hypothetical protein